MIFCPLFYRYFWQIGRTETGSMAHATNIKICKRGDDVIAVALLLRMRLLISIQILLLLLLAGCRREDKSSLPPLTYSAFSFRRLEVERIVQASVMLLGRSRSF